MNGRSWMLQPVTPVHVIVETGHVVQDVSLLGLSEDRRVTWVRVDYRIVTVDAGAKALKDLALGGARVKSLASSSCAGSGSGFLVC